MNHVQLTAVRFLAVTGLVLAACAPAAQPSAPVAPATPKAADSKPAAADESIDALYQRAKGEGGTLAFYGTLAQVNAEKILPAFEQRFPGIKVEHIDATTDKLVARAVTEARGGKTLGDVFQTPIDGLQQVRDQGLFLDWVAPESSSFPANLKGTWWVASDTQFWIIAWNTNLVKKGEEPRKFDDLADPKWKGKLIGEPRDGEMLQAWAKEKFQDETKAIDLLKKIAANQPEFHKGHSELAELLVAGQAAVCFTCYSHHYPSRIKKGAPVDYSLDEGIGGINGTAVFKDAPHPNTAKLYARWVASEEGQKAYAAGGRTPAHPNVQPTEKIRPEKIYAVGPSDLPNLARFDKIWKETFQIR